MNLIKQLYDQIISKLTSYISNLTSYISSLTSNISSLLLLNQQTKQEALKKQQEEALKKQQEEAEALKKQQEEAEALKRQQEAEVEAARIQQEQQKQQEADAKAEALRQEALKQQEVQINKYISDAESYYKIAKNEYDSINNVSILSESINNARVSLDNAKKFHSMAPVDSDNHIRDAKSSFAVVSHYLKTLNKNFQDANTNIDEAEKILQQIPETNRTVYNNRIENIKKNLQVLIPMKDELNSLNKEINTYYGYYAIEDPK
jgi:chromosome segregation ATPase